MTEEEARTLYRQGEDAVVAILMDLFRRVQALEEQTAKNSGNSSKPPSSDGLSKPALKPMPQSLRKKTGKKPGGQKGQTGKTLLQVEQPDQIVLHRPSSCPHCQTSVQDSPTRTYSRRQVFEMPEPRIVVTEHRREVVNCPCCGKESGGTFPVGIDHPVQYGPHLLGFATYLHSVHLLPFARCAQILQDITMAPFSVGSLSQALATAFTQLEPFDAQLEETLAQVGYKYADETGSRIAGKLQWIHVRCTKTLCRLFRHNNRGSVAVDDLTQYSGILMSDFYSSYVRLCCSHQFCGAHLLRELTFAHEVLGQSWAGSLKSIIEQMVACCHRARAEGAVSVENADTLCSAFDNWVEQGLASNPLPTPKQRSRGRPAKGKVRCLLERLRDFRCEYLAFLFDLSLPFTNNEAERDLRMLKVKGKISGCFRTGTGADVFCRLRSYILTCQKQGMRVLDCLCSVFVGNPKMPDLSPA
jgi:transposase